MAAFLDVVMIGATGAVGSACARALMARHDLGRLTTLGRRPVKGLTGGRVVLQPVLVGRLRKFRGVHVEVLGQAMAQHAGAPGAGDEMFHWDDFMNLNPRRPPTRP